MVGDPGWAMISWLRASAVLLLVALVTPPLALLQYLAVKTGVLDDLLPNLWHRFIVRIVGLRLHVHGRMADRRPLLLAGNHISWMMEPRMNAITAWTRVQPSQYPHIATGPTNTVYFRKPSCA
jgi:hypothetical protein